MKDAFGNVAPSLPRGEPRAVKRTPLHEGQVLGRNGEILTRNRVSGDGYVNEFDIPEDFKDPKYDLHWARTSTHGKADQANLNELYDNGWRPASPLNYARVMPDMAGKATIERDGLMLMERPWELSHLALAEERDAAVRLREIQGEAFGGRKLAKGFEAGRKSSNGKFNASKILNRGLERAPVEARPQYEYAGPDDSD